MNFPPEVVRSVQLFHLSKTGGQTQPYPTSPSLTAQAAVLPMDRSAYALEGMTFTDAWEIYFPPTTDVRVQDKVLIAGDANDYFVRSTFNANFGELAHVRATVSKQI